MSRSRDLQCQFDHDYDDQRNIKIGNWLWYTTSNADQFDAIMTKHQTLFNLMIIVVLINIKHTYIADQFACNYDHHQHYLNL